MRKMFLLCFLGQMFLVLSCNNTMEETLYNKKTERQETITENTAPEVPVITETADESSRWNRVSFGAARWAR